MKVTSLVLNNFVHDNRVMKEALTLLDLGNEVHIVCIHASGLEENEVINGIHVTRIKLRSKWLPGFIVFQAIKYLEFMFRVIASFGKRDVFHCHDLNALPIGVMVKKFFNRKVKIVYDAHEYETERNGLSNFSKSLSKFLERRLIKHADKVIAVSEGIANEYTRLYGVKPHLILNCPEPKKESASNYLREHFDIADSAKIFIYQGGLINGRAVQETIAAFSTMDNDKVIVFVGYGHLAEMVKEAADKNKNIFYHEAVRYEQLLSLTSSADVGLALIENICLSYYMSLPNKFFEYMAAGLPVIATNLQEMAKIVERHNIGTLTEGNAVDKIVKSVSLMADADLSTFDKGIEEAQEIYTWQNQETELKHLYKSLND